MSKLSEKWLSSGKVDRPHGNSSIAEALRTSPVGDSTEFQRIKNLPRRKLEILKTSCVIERDGVKKEVPDLTPIFARPEGTLKLWPIQNAAIWEASHANGGFLNVAVGGGKTLISLLLSEAMDSKKTVILVKPQLKTQLIKRDLPFFLRHFYIPLKNISVVAYTDLSSAKQRDILDRIKPDLIVADEAHSLRIRSSARTRRFLRYMRENPQTRFVALSGTMTKRSIMDFAHLAELSLKKNSFLPLNFRILEEWAEALDQSDDPKPPGVLRSFCEGDEPVRVGFRKRMVETAGVVASTEDSLGSSLVIQKRPLAMPKEVTDELNKLYTTWQIEDEELADGMALARVARQIVCGLYLRWQWPNNVKDQEWVLARRMWHRAVRTYLQHNNRDGMDSPFLLAKAAMEGRWDCPDWPAWDAVRSRPEPETVAKWVSPFMVRDAVLWGRERLKNKENGVIWYEHVALGEAIANVGNFPLYGAGVSPTMTNADKEPVLVCSIRAHGTGWNGQSYNKCLITTPPSSGLTFEQLLARQHRPGQLADECTVDIYLHCDEFKRAFTQAIKDAHFLQETQGNSQKLLFATKLFDLDTFEDLVQTDKKSEE